MKKIILKRSFLYLSLNVKMCTFPWCSQASLRPSRLSSRLPPYSSSLLVFSNQKLFYIFMKLWCGRQHWEKSFDLWSQNWIGILFLLLSALLCEDVIPGAIVAILKIWGTNYTLWMEEQQNKLCLCYRGGKHYLWSACYVR